MQVKYSGAQIMVSTYQSQCGFWKGWALTTDHLPTGQAGSPLTIFISLILTSATAMAQVTVSPAFPTADEAITITYDATQGTSGLAGAANVFMHAGVILSGTTGTSWQHVVGTWGDPTSPGEMTSLGNDKWSLTITPRQYFSQAGLPTEARVYRIGMVFREGGPCGGVSGVTTACQEGKSAGNGDIYVEIYEAGEFTVSFDQPSASPLFVDNGEQILITANASETSSLTLKINGVVVESAASATTISYTHTVTGETGFSTVEVEANNGTETKSVSFQYIVRTTTVSEIRPAGIMDGINYHADATKATLSVWAPGKYSAYLLGDFTGWEIDPAYQMKQDGEHFWFELTGLTEGEEYAFQYLIDESVYIADPYTDKILDTDDQYIPATTYPDLKPYPAEAEKDQWYFNKLAVLQTGQQPYAWQVTDFEKPPKEKLVVYELLVRDFLGEGDNNYQNLIDTLSYLKRLGINAIELMPINEFNGNESWGYNPTFMFAPDKYYGTKNKLKEFIDKCHQNGIAVIIDIVMNHQDIPNPYVLMDYDFAAGKPEAENRWFNVDATHPFNVFFDMNHESPYTQKYLDTVNHYWLHEYKVDGYRFDLSKGFTQVNNPDNVGAWSDYDASRIVLLKRMADEIWSHSPDAYVILEHLSVNSEEKELAEYRSDEGKGMLFWGKMTEPYNENTMGYENGSDISWILHSTRGWDVPHVVGYMESHDEERLMVTNERHGKNASGHNTKTTEVALRRMAAAATIFYTIPGPKMLWQFGELGYDYSINYCPDGTIDNGCRLSPKPVRWDYREEPERYALYQHISDLNRLRKEFNVFTEGTATLDSGEDLIKQLTLRNNPYTATPSQASEMNAVIVVNFDVMENEVSPGFLHTGIWYDYYSGSREIEVGEDGIDVSLKPGEYKLYTDYPIESPFITSVEEPYKSAISVYPNPVGETLVIKNEGLPVNELALYTHYGMKVNLFQIDDHSWDVKQLPAGFYIAVFRTRSATHRVKIIKK